MLKKGVTGTVWCTIYAQTSFAIRRITLQPLNRPNAVPGRQAEGEPSTTLCDTEQTLLYLTRRNGDYKELWLGITWARMWLLSYSVAYVWRNTRIRGPCHVSIHSACDASNNTSLQPRTQMVPFTVPSAETNSLGLKETLRSFPRISSLIRWRMQRRRPPSTWKDQWCPHSANPTGTILTGTARYVIFQAVWHACLRTTGFMTQ